MKKIIFLYAYAYHCIAMCNFHQLLGFKQVILMKQYPLKPKVEEALKPITENLKKQGLLIPYNTPCNTPILGIKMSNDKWKDAL